MLYYAHYLYILTVYTSNKHSTVKTAPCIAADYNRLIRRTPSPNVLTVDVILFRTSTVI